MNNKIVFFIGLLGVSLFAFSSILGGFLIEDYSVVSQYISETYAIDTEYGMMLRTIGIIPSGVLITIFCLLGYKYFQPSILTRIGFYGLAIFYGLATIVVGIFPCDSGCNRAFIDPSISQIIHNMTGFATYLFTPISIILIGLGLRELPNCNKLSLQALAYGAISFLFVSLLSIDPDSGYIGLCQRLIETMFIVWIITCAFAIRNKVSVNN